MSGESLERLSGCRRAFESDAFKASPVKIDLALRKGLRTVWLRGIGRWIDIARLSDCGPPRSALLRRSPNFGGEVGRQGEAGGEEIEIGPFGRMVGIDRQNGGRVDFHGDFGRARRPR